MDEVRPPSDISTPPVSEEARRRALDFERRTSPNTDGIGRGGRDPVSRDVEGEPGQGSGEQASRMMVSGFIKACWAFLWETFGHSIYLIDLLFLLQAGSGYLRRFIPAVGEEWFAPEALKNLPKSSLLPIKLAEIVGMVVITALVIALDVLFVTVIAILLAVVTAAANHL